jgi:CRP-like cAMP-binding protein
MKSNWEAEKSKELFSFISKYMELTDEEKTALLERDIFKSYQKGHVLFEAGDITNEYYLVLKGCIRTYHINDAGQDNTIEFYTELHSYAPPSTIEGTESTLYASCLVDSLLVVSTPDIEADVFRLFPRFETLCRILSEKAAGEILVKYEQFKNLDPEQRYLHLLENRPNLVQRVPQYHLASYLGIRPESLSRIRKRLTGRRKRIRIS